MEAKYNVPTTEHERRFLIYTQVLCVRRSVTSLLPVTPAGVPVGRRAASARPEINIMEMQWKFGKFTGRAEPVPYRCTEGDCIDRHAVRG